MTASLAQRQAVFPIHLASVFNMNTYLFGFQGFCLNRIGLVVRVEGQGLARRFFVHWDDHPAKVSVISFAAAARCDQHTGIPPCAGTA
jgi:hypothetical protein